MSTKKAPKANAGVTVITPDNEAEPITPHVELITVPEQIKRDVSKFDTNMQAIAALQKKYGKLTINGVEDTVGYKAVDEARKIVKKKAAAVETKRKEIKADYIEIGKGIDLYAKKLNDPLRALESELDGKLTVIDEENDRLQREREEAETKQLNDRVTALETAGLKFTGAYYSIGENISLDIVTIKTLNDAEFDELLTRVTKEKNRLDKEEAQRLQEEQEEKERLQREKDELLTQQNQLREQQEELQRGQELLKQQQAEIKKERNNKRRQILLGAGLQYDYVLNPGGPTGPDGPRLMLDTPSGKVEVSIIDLEESDEQTWQSKLEPVLALAREITAAENVRLKEVEQLKQRTSNRIAQLVALEFHAVDSGYFFKNQITGNQTSVLNENIENQSETDWEGHLKQLRQFIANEGTEASKIIKQREQAAEKLRKDGLNDWQLISEYATTMRTAIAESPKLKRDDMSAEIGLFNDKVVRALDELLNAGEQLSK